MIDGIATLTIVASTMIIATPIVRATSPSQRREPALAGETEWTAPLTLQRGRPQAPATSRRAKIAQPAASGMRL